MKDRPEGFFSSLVLGWKIRWPESTARIYRIVLVIISQTMEFKALTFLFHLSNSHSSPIGCRASFSNLLQIFRNPDPLDFFRWRVKISLFSYVDRTWTFQIAWHRYQSLILHRQWLEPSCVCVIRAICSKLSSLLFLLACLSFKCRLFDITGVGAAFPIRWTTGISFLNRRGRLRPSLYFWPVFLVRYFFSSSLPSKRIGPTFSSVLPLHSR